MWTLRNKIYFIKNSSWKFYEVRSERRDFNWYWFWSSYLSRYVLTLMLWWYLSPARHFYSDWLWPYCELGIGLGVAKQKLPGMWSKGVQSKGNWHPIYLWWVSRYLFHDVCIQSSFRVQFAACHKPRKLKNMFTNMLNLRMSGIKFHHHLIF